MKVVIVLLTVVLIAGWGCGSVSSVQAQNPPQFTGTFAFGNGPLVGAINANNGNLTGTMVFAGSCLAQIAGTYQEPLTQANNPAAGQTAFGQLTATPVATTTCPGTSVALSFFVAVSSTKAYFSFNVTGTNNQFPEEGFK